ncbi:hypothetical protein pb186bvf_014116 [Paramecium bursaria]
MKQNYKNNQQNINYPFKSPQIDMEISTKYMEFYTINRLYNSYIKNLQLIYEYISSKYESQHQGSQKIQWHQIDENLLNQIQEQFHIYPNEQIVKEVNISEQKQHNFQRRIVPFFMNQFMHWASQMGYKQVDGYLKTIHKKKTSKQQKFELGDLKKLFGNINPRTKHIQLETQLKWKEFLFTQAEICVLINNKIKDQETKTFYVQAIKHLKEELQKEQPYDKFLSITKKENSESTIDLESYQNQFSQKQEVEEEIYYDNIDSRMYFEDSY